MVKATMVNCDALLFDVDGTLVDSTAAVIRVWRRWSDDYAVDFDAVMRVCHGRRSLETIREFVRPDLIPAALLRHEHLELTDLDDVVACPGAADLLATLDRQGDPSVALVSSGSLRLVTARMTAAGLPLPKIAVTAGSVARGKPDPEGYLRAADLLGRSPSRCAVVEDAPAGVSAGRRAGATVIAVTTTFPADALRDAHLVVTSLDQLVVTPGTVEVAGPHWTLIS